MLSKQLLKLLLLASLPFAPLYSFDKATIATDLRKIIKTFDPAVHIGVMVYDLKNKEIIFQENSNHLFVPASNTKLFTAAAALHYLGSDFRFKTQLMLDGNTLYLKADGDPTLTKDQLAALFTELNKKNITHIEGDLCLDLTVFDAQPYASGYFWDDETLPWNSPVGALTIDRICISRPTALVQYELRTLLSKAGITWNGVLTARTSPAHAPVVAEHQSQPLRALLAPMLRNSDNLMTDALFKRVGAAASGGQGSWDAGIAAIQAFLEHKVGLASHAYIIQDGSGRSRYNHISPEQIIKLLVWVHGSGHAQHVIESLPVPGGEGTLALRMLDMKESVHAKSGSLPGVTGLSGYITIDGGRELAFTIIINGYVQSASMAGALPIKTFRAQGPNYKLLENEICSYLVQHI